MGVGEGWEGEEIKEKIDLLQKHINYILRREGMMR